MQMRNCGIGVADTCGLGHGGNEMCEDRARMVSARRYSFDGRTPSSICPIIRGVGWMNGSVAQLHWHHHRARMN